MRKVFLILTALLCLRGTAKAQWAVFDPSNFAQSIVNSANEMIETSTTAQNMINNWKETIKIYEQSKGYYDKLKTVSNLVRDARKVQQSILMVGEISEIYVKNFDRMLTDKNFTDRELAAIASGYTRLLQEASNALSDMKDIINPTDMSLTDKDRIDIVERVYDKIAHYRNLTSYYTRKNISISFLRARKANDTKRVMELYGSDASKYW